MRDVVTQVTTQSWGSRVKNSCSGIIFGIILTIVSFPLLWWNEGRAVRRHKTLVEGSKSVISVSAETVDSSNAGKLVHLSDVARAGSSVSDATFGVDAPGALKLKRHVEMYQWVETTHKETEKKTGGSTETTTTYEYTTSWQDHSISSDRFFEPNGHENPGNMPYQSTSTSASPISVGAFELPRDLMRMINWYEPLNSAEMSTNNIPDENARSKAQTYNNGFYFGDNPSSPQVGDTRVTFHVVPEGDVSILAAQTTGGELTPYLSKVGGSIFILEHGMYTAEVMFEHAEAQNRLTTWILRCVGFFLMFFGFNLVLQPLEVFSDAIPFVGNLVGAASNLLAFFMAGILSTVVIAVAWLVYRPILSFFLLGIAAGLVYILRTKACNAKSEVSLAGGHMIEENEGERFPVKNTVVELI